MSTCLVLGQVSCGQNPPPAKEKKTIDAPETSAATSQTVDDASKKAEAPGEIFWFEDDALAAFERAKAQKKPLFVDLWAPWCHTCIAMKGHILLAKNFEEVKDRFIFLAIDTEKDVNAEFLRKFPVEVWPTFYVIDPDTDTIAGRWLGAGSVQQIRGFLKDGEATIAQSKAGSLAPDDPVALMLAGDREAAAKRYPEAAQRYKEALEKAPADWARRPDVLVSRITAFYRGKDYSSCVDLGIASMKETGNTSSATDFAAFALTCASKLPQEKTDPRVETLRKAVAERLSALADDANSLLSVDDRSDAYANLQGVRESLGDVEGAKAAAEKRVKVLEEGMKGETDEISVAYDWSLADAYLYLNRPDEALALLTKREAALPKNYNPPHYLARAYHKLKREDEALAAIDRAISRAYGPRKAGMMSVKADILEALGKKAEAKAAIEEQLALYQALPEGQKLPEREAASKERIEKLSASSTK